MITGVTDLRRDTDNHLTITRHERGRFRRGVPRRHRGHRRTGVSCSKTVLAKHDSAPRPSGARSFGGQPFLGRARYGTPGPPASHVASIRAVPALSTESDWFGCRVPVVGGRSGQREPRRPLALDEVDAFLQWIVAVCSTTRAASAEFGLGRLTASLPGSPASMSRRRHPRSCHTTLACSAHG